jgi:hypothetical protein
MRQCACALNFSLDSSSEIYIPNPSPSNTVQPGNAPNEPERSLKRRPLWKPHVAFDEFDVPVQIRKSGLAGCYDTARYQSGEPRKSQEVLRALAAGVLCPILLLCIRPNVKIIQTTPIPRVPISETFHMCHVLITYFGEQNVMIVNGDTFKPRVNKPRF